jgi:hypothetical protein
MKENIKGLFSGVSSLFETKYQINPMMQILGNIIRLQSGAMFVNKVLGRARPGWQQNIMNPLTTV